MSCVTPSRGSITDPVKVRSHMRGAEAGGKLASTQIITCVHTCAAVHEMASRPLAQFDLILAWASWNCCERLKIIMECTNIQFCERLGHGWQFHPLARSRSGGGAGAKSALQQMGPTANFPRPLQNRALQTIIVLKKWQIRLRPPRICVNIPVVAEREYQNPCVSTLQPLRAYVNVA